MGEIGISPSEFRKMRWWEVKAAIEGNARRCRQQWAMTRWHAYNVMSAIPYADLKKNGIFRPSDLLEFPWEGDNMPISAEEGDELLREIQDFNNTKKNENYGKYQDF